MDIEKPGVLSVVKSDGTVSELRQYLLSLDMGRVGPITIIYSKGRATSNSVLVVSRDLYDLIIDTIDSQSPIAGIEPYMVTDNHFPSCEQTSDIFLRFDCSEELYPNPKWVSSSIRKIIFNLVSFKIVDLTPKSFNVDISSNHIGFIRFSPNTPTYIPIYIRSVFNGHILGSCKVSAYWCSKSPR
jgi:hypothetical protein